MKTVFIFAALYFLCLSIWDGTKHAMSSGTIVNEDKE